MQEISKIVYLQVYASDGSQGVPPFASLPYGISRPFPTKRVLSGIYYLLIYKYIVSEFKKAFRDLWQNSAAQLSQRCLLTMCKIMSWNYSKKSPMTYPNPWTWHWSL
jgi:hypothetical protein